MGIRAYKIFFSAIFLAALALPVSALASVAITEIMYDLPGTDSGHEWVEITNTGGSPVDVSAYKFFQGGVNHGLSVASGSGVLGVEQSAVIIEDQSKFMADNPQFAGTLFKSSFSLSNIGETLGLKDASLTAEDSISYSSDLGASGDGNSLHRSGDTFIAGVPIPGVFSENPGSSSSGDPASATPATTSEPQIQTKQSGGGPLAPSMEVDTGGDRTVEAGAGAFFEGHIYNSSGVPMQNARYIWNFGNGETREGQTVFYAYPYPGTYAVVLTVDAGNGYATTARSVVEAVPAEVAVSESGDGSITVANVTHAGKDLDLSLWALSRGGTIFTIPKGTVILPGKAVRFSPDILKLPPGDMVLLYPNGLIAARPGAGAGSSHAPGIEYLDDTQAAPQLFSSGTVRTNSPTPAAAVQKASPAENPRAQTAATAESGASFPASLPLVGLGALVVLGVAGVVFAGKRSGTQEIGSHDASADADEEAEEFTIRSSRPPGNP